MISWMSNLSLCWRSRGSFFSPEPFCFDAFFWGIFLSDFRFVRFTQFFRKFLFRYVRFSSCESVAQILFWFSEIWVSIFYLKFESRARSLLVFSVPASTLSLFRNGELGIPGSHIWDRSDAQVHEPTAADAREIEKATCENQDPSHHMYGCTWMHIFLSIDQIHICIDEKKR